MTSPSRDISRSLLPTLHEPIYWFCHRCLKVFPNVVLEAMALKTPVLAADIPVIRQLGRIGVSANDRGYDCVATFECGNADSLAKKMRSVQLNSTARRSRLNCCIPPDRNVVEFRGTTASIRKLFIASCRSFGIDSCHQVIVTSMSQDIGVW